MNEKTVVITERDGSYQIQNNGISDFALLGILECIVFEMKTASRKEAIVKQKDISAERSDINREQNENDQNQKVVIQETKREAVAEPAAPNIRIRISNAIKTIRALGAEIEESDLGTLTDEELQSELAELTEQYKRLKSSKANG